MPVRIYVPMLVVQAEAMAEKIKHQEIEADCVSAMAEMEQNSVDAIVTDPPYGLEFMGKEWDRLRNTWEAPKGRYHNDTNFLARGDRIRYEAGVPMQAWHQRWAEQALRVLKPGGHMLVMGGTRTYHRMVCAVEDAGFEVRDTCCFLHGVGFPKGHDIEKVLRKKLERAIEEQGCEFTEWIDG